MSDTIRGEFVKKRWGRGVEGALDVRMQDAVRAEAAARPQVSAWKRRG